MTYYDTLGITPSATTDEVKQAYRRCASAAHPDRHGGDASEMAAINSAYECLGDTERRRAYDETGVDTQPDALEVEARGMLMQLFTAAIAGEGNWIETVSGMLAMHRTELTRHQSDAQGKRSRLIKRRHWVKIKQGENLVHGLIDQQVQGIEEALKKMQRGLDVNGVARGMLTAYEFVGEQPAQQQLSSYARFLGLWQG